MNKSIVPIKGMHCRSCEILIEEKLKELPEIKNIQVNYKKKRALIYSKHALDMHRIGLAVSEAGYEVGIDDRKNWISRNPAEYRDLGIALLILFGLYLWAKGFGLGSISVGGNSGNPSSLLVVLVVGLTAGISTCMALVGGLVLGISARHAEKHPEANAVQKFRPHLFFNLGRVLSFFILGGLIGLMGKAFQLSGPVLGMLTVFVGLVMLILGLQLTEMFPRLSSGGVTLPAGINKLLGIKKHHDKEYSHGNSILIGALTFFLPCGFTQAMQLYAISTGSFWSGALIMGVFALGTAPGLLGIGGLTAMLRGSFAKKFFKFAGLLVIFLALFNISNGWNLTGWKNIFASSNSSETITKDDPNVTMENGVQVVRMTQVASGYKPNKFTVKQGIPVKWVIDSKDSGSCAASISMPKQNIRQSLKPGENIIQFTPKETGELKFTCSMGMYSGRFIVVASDSAKNTTSTPEIAQNSNPTAPVLPIEEAKPAPSAKPTTQGNDAPVTSTAPSPSANEPQIIKAAFNEVSWEATSDISPNEFTVKADKPVHFEITANANGVGCMSTIMIPGLIDDPVLLRKGQTIKWDFTPSKGTYDITCAMGVPRGKIIVV